MTPLLLAALLTISPAAGKIKVDGHLNDPGWAGATRVTTFYEVEPGDSTPPPVPTEALVTYDKHNIYVAFECTDPSPEEIRAHLEDRDSAFQDDFAGIMIDTFNAQRRGYEFFVNPLGIQMDLLTSEGSGEDGSWDTLWESAGRITEKGYIVEIAIPFKSLRFPNESEQSWRLSLFRVYPRDFRYQISSVPVDRNKNCFLCQWQEMTGLREIKPGRNVEIIPSFTAQRNDEREDSSLPFEEGGVVGEGSLNASWSVTPNLTFNAAINPDFSQVEADVMQLDVNSRFALFYPEKRPFFMEGSNIFDTPLNVVYTRAIADPNWGLKFTGKEGKMTYGIVTAQDDIANFTLPGAESSSLASWNHALSSSIFRIKRDVGEDSSIGLIATHREGGDYHNTLFGFDGRIRLGKNDFITGQIVTSDTQDPLLSDGSMNGESRNGIAANVEYSHEAEEWSWSLEGEIKDDDFRADLGFIPQVGTKSTHGYLSRTWYGKKGAFFSRVQPSLYTTAVWNENSLLLDRTSGIRIFLQMPLQTSFFAGLERNFEHYDGEDYNRSVFWSFWNMRLSKSFSLNSGLTLGDKVDYANNRLGDRYDWHSGMTWQPGRHFKAMGTVQQEKLSDGETIFRARLYIFRFNYHLNRRAFIRALFQNQDLSRNPSLYVDEVSSKEKAWATQLLFSYRMNAFTLLYLGYSDNGIEDDWTPKTTMGRSYFLKLSYAFRP